MKLSMVYTYSLAHKGWLMPNWFISEKLSDTVAN